MAQVEFTWTADVAWFGEVVVFDNCFGTGTPVFVKQDEDALGNPIASTQHTVVINVGAGAPLASNTHYCFKVTATDPTGIAPAFSTPPSLLFFTGGAPASGCCFTGGPSVRVTHNIPPFDVTRVEIRWTANFVGYGRVWIFDNPNGGIIIDGNLLQAATGHWSEHSVGGLLHADTTYYFRVIHEDPTGVRPDITNDPAPYTSFFTGAQAIGDVRVVADTNNAIISWDANVIGLGRVEYSSSSPGDAHVVDDRNNQAEHSMALTGLQPGTTYEYRVCNRHAFDGDCLAEQTGSFTTPSVSSGASVGCDSNALIAAIDSANDASGDILELSPGCTYTLNQPSIPGGPDQMPVGLPAITRAIIIHGNGATITRGGIDPPPLRILQVDSTGTLVFDDLTVSGGELTGSSGGGILNRGTLTITHSTISGNVADNSGGAIYNLGGELTVNQSNISGNQAFLGGGIANGGNLTVTQSTISDNIAQSGGGIFNSGTVTVTQSTISGNESTNSNADYGGAAIHNDLYRELSVVLSTISGNVSQSRGGGIYNRGGTVAVTQSTIFGNEAASGGGIEDNGWASGIVNLSQSIIAGNLPGNCPSTPGITDGGYNLEDGTGCGFPQATSFSNTDPVLGPLQDNGGPTFTHALLPGSPAIDKGISNGLDTDQRGPDFPRIWDDPDISDAPGGDGADIGAFEGFDLPSDDSTPPTITPTGPDQTLWYGSDVSVPCTAMDSGSGLADPGDASFMLSTSVPAGTETSSALTDSREVCDQANNCATAGPFTFQVDKKKPVITISVPANGATYTLGEVIAAAYTCDDETGSGIATCAGPVANGANIDTSAGSHIFMVTSTDNVGNANSASVTYSVGYAFSGFLSPVDNPPTVNTGKAGRTYSVKWQLRDGNGNFVSALSAVVGITVKATPCDSFTSDPTDALETTATGGTALRYDSATNQYVYNWATPGKGCYTLFLQLDSGQVFTAFFQLN